MCASSLVPCSCLLTTAQVRAELQLIAKRQRRKSCEGEEFPVNDAEVARVAAKLNEAAACGGGWKALGCRSSAVIRS